MTEDEYVAATDLSLVRAALAICRNVSGLEADQVRALLAELEATLAGRVEDAIAGGSTTIPPCP